MAKHLWAQKLFAVYTNCQMCRLRIERMTCDLLIIMIMSKGKCSYFTPDNVEPHFYPAHTHMLMYMYQTLLRRGRISTRG